MNKKLLGGLGIATLATALAVAFVPTINNNLAYALSRSGNSYSCASIHFGMNDSTKKGYIATYGPVYTEGNSPYTDKELGVSTVGIEEFSVSGTQAQWLCAGAKYTVSKVEHTAINDHALKLGGSSASSTLTLTLDSYISGCDIYAVGHKSDANNFISINGGAAVIIPKNDLVTGNILSDTLLITYDKYHFDFDTTNELSITCNRRVFIGDIALRVTGSVPTTKYTISFDSNGGSGTMASVEKNAGSSYELPANGFTAPSGKTFDAWEVNSVRKNPSDVISVDSNIIVKALWKDKSSEPTQVERGDSSPLSTTAEKIDDNITIKVNSANSYSAPIRVYANTTITINALNGHKLKSITYKSSSTGSYVTNAQEATVTPSVTPTVSGKNVTWEFTGNVTEFTFKPSAQTRSNGFIIIYE